MRTLDIHNLIQSEGLIEVRTFIKESYELREYDVIIVHGYGTLVLKEMVHGECARNPLVMEFENAPPSIGGGGATKLKLKHKRKVSRKYFPRTNYLKR